MGFYVVGSPAKSQVPLRVRARSSSMANLSLCDSHYPFFAERLSHVERQHEGNAQDICVESSSDRPVGIGRGIWREGSDQDDWRTIAACDKDTADGEA
jgi:hypothetical protein